MKLSLHTDGDYIPYNSPIQSIIKFFSKKMSNTALFWNISFFKIYNNNISRVKIIYLPIVITSLLYLLIKSFSILKVLGAPPQFAYSFHFVGVLWFPPIPRKEIISVMPK